RPEGTLAIGHTRWATHGRPSNANAHPHLDCHAQLAVVHNGIIENYRELRKTLAAEGHRFRSQTDTEVIAHLIERYQTNGLAAAVLRAARDLRGAFAIACIASAAPNTLVALRRGSSPLVIGYGRGEMFVAADIASEFRYRRPVLDSRVLTVPISQSGETADTLAALREAKDQGSRAVAICNVVGSSLAREADGVVYTRAGLEIGVASTKAF